MWERLCTIWKTPVVRNKLLFTFGMLVIYSILSAVTVPLTGEQRLKLGQTFSGQGLGQLLSLLDTFSGGSLQTFSIVALGVYPYITASIVIKLLTPIIPALQELQLQGEQGRQRLNQYTRLITIPLAFLEGVGHLSLFTQSGVFDANAVNLFGPDWLYVLALLCTLVAGTMILLWVGELITEYGIGNGVSLLIFAGIISGLPGAIKQELVTRVASGFAGNSIVSLCVLLLLILLIVVGTIYLYQGQRRVPIDYPTKRNVAQGLLVGKTRKSYIPMQVNSTGMIPLIFANSLMLFPVIVARFLTNTPVPWLGDIARWSVTYLTNTSLWYYWSLYFVLVVAFTYFYAYVQWQEQNIPDALQKQGAVVMGHRPGAATSAFLRIILNRLTLCGAIALGLIALAPFLAHSQVLNGARLLIVTGVILDTLKQLNAHLVMRNYSGFLA